ncbi:hypothetical protein NM688_g4499 [Phlebia brevispora]|uniref:Uncharacterized protein n=1 Tax=Phlebia brevispora TaxID=194682 RepID=A0ACC1T341_9APHY|nr:hypothetical protein NM688_g4499 [Phlebia brevispora]
MFSLGERAVISTHMDPGHRVGLVQLGLQPTISDQLPMFYVVAPRYVSDLGYSPDTCQPNAKARVRNNSATGEPVFAKIGIAYVTLHYLHEPKIMSLSGSGHQVVNIFTRAFRRDLCVIVSCAAAERHRHRMPNLAVLGRVDVILHPVASKWMVVLLVISVVLNGYLLKGIAAGAGQQIVRAGVHSRSRVWVAENAKEGPLVEEYAPLRAPAKEAKTGAVSPSVDFLVHAPKALIPQAL